MYVKQFDVSGSSQALLFVMMFGFIWFSAFIVNNTHFVCYVSAATFYFSSNKDRLGQAQVMLGVKWAYTKHMGSLALGALIHAIIEVLRNAAENNNGRGGAAKCIAACILCLLQNIMDYIDKICYAYMAITGEPYCKSARNAMLINLKHLWKFYFARSIARMFTTMGFFFITAFTIGIYFALLYMFGTAYDMQSLIGPVILMLLMCIFICHLFLGLFDEAVMGTLMAVAVDMDLNGVQNCQYGPEGLHKGLA